MRLSVNTAESNDEIVVQFNWIQTLTFEGARLNIPHGFNRVVLQSEQSIANLSKLQLLNTTAYEFLTPKFLHFVL